MTQGRWVEWKILVPVISIELSDKHRSGIPDVQFLELGEGPGPVPSQPSNKTRTARSFYYILCLATFQRIRINAQF